MPENVALIYNPKSGHVSAQYHCVFDSGFTTVAGSTAATKRNMASKFETLFKSDRWQYTDDFEDEQTQYYQADEAWETIDDDAFEEAPALKRTKPSEVVEPTPVSEGAGDHEDDEPLPGPKRSEETVPSVPPTNEPMFEPGDKILIPRSRDTISDPVSKETTRDIGIQTMDTGDQDPPAPATDVGTSTATVGPTEPEATTDRHSSMLNEDEEDDPPSEDLPAIVSQLSTVDRSQSAGSRPESVPRSKGKTVSFNLTRKQRRKERKRKQGSTPLNDVPAPAQRKGRRSQRKRKAAKHRTKKEKMADRKSVV